MPSKRGTKDELYGIIKRDLADGSVQQQLGQTNINASPLFRLPLEVRDMIYKFVLGGNHIIMIYQSRQREGGYCCRTFNQNQNPFLPVDGKVLPSGLTLLNGVCRQLYKETAILPYQWHIWAFSDWDVCKRFLMEERRLPLPQRRAIKAVICNSHGTPKTLIRFLGGLNVMFVVPWFGPVLRVDIQKNKEVGERFLFDLQRSTACSANLVEWRLNLLEA